MYSTSTYQPVQKAEVNQGNMKEPTSVKMEEAWNNFYPLADDSDREKLKFNPRVKRHITESISG